MRRWCSSTRVSIKTAHDLRHKMGLDKPAYEEYFYWVGGVVRLDFGNSLRDRSSISHRLRDALPTT